MGKRREGDKSTKGIKEWKKEVERSSCSFPVNLLLA
jgi:hypothetical protein